jgi:orotate phosphoribosyltransferase
MSFSPDLKSRECALKLDAADRARTGDLPVNSRVLYQLSYSGSEPYDVLVIIFSHGGTAKYSWGMEYKRKVFPMDGIDIGEYLLKNGNIKFGKFTLSSGKESDYYVDVKSALLNPRFLREVSEMASKYVTGDKVAAVELGAVPFGVAVSLETGKDLIIIRKERKEYGLEKWMEGKVEMGETVTFVEDVTTTGGTILRAIMKLKDIHVRTDRVIVVVDRKEGAREALEYEGIELISLVNIDDLRHR